MDEPLENVPRRSFKRSVTDAGRKTARTPGDGGIQTHVSPLRMGCDFFSPALGSQTITRQAYLRWLERASQEEQDPDGNQGPV